MPYILNKTNGTILTTVQDATVDNTSSLTFLGKNFTGYGQAIEENLVHLLENFANSSAPVGSIAGQIWFNTATNQLNVTRDGTNWKGVGSITIGSTSTVNTTPSEGDFWWDSNLSQLIVYDGANYINVGPSSTSSYGSWSFGRITNTSNAQIPAIVGSLQEQSGGPLVEALVISDAVPYSTALTSPYHTLFPKIQRGINLKGAEPNLTVPTNPPVLVAGSSINSGYYFWGTAAESLATVAVELTTTTNFSTCLIPFAAASNTATSLVTTATFTYNPGTGVINATATSAFYADIAERYEADAVYEPGTVLVIGGEKEVTTTNRFADTRVAGIVSKNPAYMMNSDAGNDETHPYIALKGRVPCKVAGPIKRGDLLVTSSHPGYACSSSQPNYGTLIGKALESNSEGFGVIEVLVV